MLGIQVKKSAGLVTIRWQLSKIEINEADIIDVSSGDSYGGDDKQATRIGTPYGTTDRVVIKTKQDTYILYTSDYQAIKQTIEA
ncbi:hypothetical protein DES38_103131 [Streptohalobacillus salinus]|uniref:Sublancin immunity protein SunI-like PH domain-containing protein n=1 Tax=Streptohalobacillus salinus TaxID=621096 RepID=A0A2V3WC20_9BACI|nr:hypothetical protein [Streptohalobacillus salinus]PXW92115.1 hypothetical protein DES38_103131 [Streptohalobacillus salinus]